MTVVVTLPFDATERVFPAGTTLSVYAANDQVGATDALPQGSAVATGIVADPAISTPGFEGGVDDWELYETGDTDAVLAAESSIVRTGGGSAKITAGTADTAVGVSGPTAVADQIVCAEGDTITATTYVRAVAGTKNANISITWVDEAESDISTDTGSNVATEAGEWVQVTVSATAPADTVTAYLRVAIVGSPATAAVYYVDDVDYYGLASGDQTSFAGLTASKDYQAWGTVSGVRRRISFRAPAA